MRFFLARFAGPADSEKNTAGALPRRRKSDIIAAMEIRREPEKKRKWEINMNKRICCAGLALAVMLVCLCVSACALDAQSAAEELSTIGMFRGTGRSFELERAPSRSEAAAMLVRLYGAEDDALTDYVSGVCSHPFSDGRGWDAPYIAWLYGRGLTRGMSSERFGASAPCSAHDYLVFLLRALGYRDGEDFSYAAAEELAASLGFYERVLFSGTFTRGDMALMTRLALGAPVRGAEQTLLEALTEQGAVAEELARPLAQAMQDAPFRIGDGQLLVRESAWNRSSYDLSLTVRFELDGDGSVLSEYTLERAELAELLRSDGQGFLALDTRALEETVAAWAERCSGSRMPFQFDSACKGLIPIPFLLCDYRVDVPALEKAVALQLLTLESGVIRAPLAAYDMSGRRMDLNATCVEVDIDNQKLTYRKNGAVIVSTDVVTGNPNGHITPTGLYYAHDKQTDCTLVGPDYVVFVSYWVGFIGNSYGLHDASWRSSFGGEIYRTNGSHGCVNIPGEAMRTIYEQIEDGTPIFIHSGT